MSALDVQVGGDHYKKLKIQPVEYMHANGIPFIEGCIIKYASRWRDKGGIADLEKIKHFAQLLIDLETKEQAEKAGWTQDAIEAAAFTGAELHAAGLGPRDAFGNPLPCNNPVRGFHSDPIIQEMANSSSLRIRDLAAIKLARLQDEVNQPMVGEQFDDFGAPLPLEPAASIDDDSARMQAIGQNGNTGEHYDEVEWLEWANWKVGDSEGVFFCEKEPDWDNALSIWSGRKCGDLLAVSNEPSAVFKQARPTKEA